jgi:hypothetical protein
MRKSIKIILGGAWLGVLVSGLQAQETGFNYQGRLMNNTMPATGIYDFQFSLFDSVTNGNRWGVVCTNVGVPANNGLFTTVVDCGPGVFNGASLWLETAVRTNGGGGFTILGPRQPVLPVPYAVFAATASNAMVAASAASVAATNLVGVLTAAQLPASVVTNGLSGVTFSGSFYGNGAGLTNLSSAAISSGGGLTNNATASIYVRPQLTGVGLWADPMAVAATNGQPLVSVSDTSGNGNTLYNGTTNSVIYLSSGINGSPGFLFPSTYSGFNTVLAYALTNQMWVPAMNTNSCITMVFKDNMEALVPISYIFSAGTNLSYLASPYDTGHSGGSLYLGPPLSLRQNLQGGHLPFVFSLRLNNGFIDLWFNGAPTMQSSYRGQVAGNALGTVMVFGNAAYGSQIMSDSSFHYGSVGGVIGDIIVHTNPPSDYELSNLHNFLLKKYGIGGGVEVVMDGANQMQGAYSSGGSNLMQITQRALPGTFLQSVSVSGATAAIQLASQSNWCRYPIPGTAEKKIAVEWWGEGDLLAGTSLSTFTNECIASVNLLHGVGMEVVGCTLVSDTNELGHYSAMTRADINNFVRNSGVYDCVCDFGSDPDMGYNGAYANTNFFIFNGVYAFLNNRGYGLLANRWLIPVLNKTINGVVSGSNNGSFTGNWTNTFNFPVVVVMTNAAATAVFNLSGVNVIPATVNPATFILGAGGWLTNAAGGGYYYSSQ